MNWFLGVASKDSRISVYLANEWLWGTKLFHDWSDRSKQMRKTRRKWRENKFLVNCNWTEVSSEIDSDADVLELFTLVAFLCMQGIFIIASLWQITLSNPQMLPWLMSAFAWWPQSACCSCCPLCFQRPSVSHAISVTVVFRFVHLLVCRH